ncbi:MAG: LuxR C-terminal-related transcriptional regulator [Anaerolineaceae bacterium]
MTDLLGGQVPSKRTFHFDERLIESLQDLAQREQRSTEELAASLLVQAIQQRQAVNARQQDWWSLSPREQEVAALVCLNYTNRQIASLLSISPETVKSHIRNVLYKFNLHNKQELKQSLEEWDFNAWASPHP